MAVTQHDRNVHLSLFSDPEMALLEPGRVLHPAELERYKAMPADRKADFLRGRYAIKSILKDGHSQMSSLLIAADYSGKPYVEANRELFCSISHADGYVAAAVSLQAAIGVDVEKIKTRHPALLRSISDTEESDRLSLIYPSEVITTVLWAIKEAVAKADERIYPRKAYKVSSSDRILVQRDSAKWDVSVTFFPMHVSVVALAI